MNDAWLKIVQNTRSCYRYHEITFRKFLDDNSDFPNKEKADKDIELSKLELKPY